MHQRLQRAIGHHTEVGMIIHHLLIHALHQLIESLGGETLEESIRLALLPHAIDDVLTFLHLFHHIHNDILVIL